MSLAASQLLMNEARYWTSTVPYRRHECELRSTALFCEQVRSPVLHSPLKAPDTYGLESDLWAPCLQYSTNSG